MFVRLTARMHNRAKEALDKHLKRRTDETDALVALLRETVIAAKGSGDPAARLAAIDTLLLPDADGIIERCEAHAALAGGNHLPLLGRFYKGQRAAFIRFLEVGVGLVLDLKIKGGRTANPLDAVPRPARQRPTQTDGPM